MAEYRKSNPDKRKATQKKAEEKRDLLVKKGLVVEPPLYTCLSCGIEKTPDNFRWKNKRFLLRASRCRSCDADHRTSLYASNPQAYMRRNKTQYRKLRAIVEQAKQVPCLDCGQKYPTYVMDFDHRDPSKKVDKVSSLVYSGSEKKLRAEIEKCDVVCANCHRIRTFGKEEKDGT